MNYLYLAVLALVIGWIVLVIANSRLDKQLRELEEEHRQWEQIMEAPEEKRYDLVLAAIARSKR